VDVCLVAAVVAGVCADALTEELLDCGQEGGVFGQGEVAVGVVCGLQTAG